MKTLSKGRYFGAKQSEWEVQGILLSEYQYLTPRTDWHYHENPYFMYVLQGDMYDVNRQQKALCPPGSLLFHNWQEPHFNSKESDRASGFHVEIEPTWLADRNWDTTLWEGSALLEEPLSHLALAKLFYEFKLRDAFSPMAIESLVLELCDSLEASTDSASHSVPSWVKPLKEILYYESGKISLAYLSEQLGVHPVHLSRSIPKYLTSNLGEYMRQLKIKRSLPYLLDPTYSLTEIAYVCGFSDQSHFIRTFKRYVSHTPKYFRNQIMPKA